MEHKPTAYWDYLKLEQLLSLQSGLAENDKDLSNDEVLFIAVHQIDEVWMKLAIRELETVRALFSAKRVPEQAMASAVRGIRRLALLFRQISGHFELLESMTTRDYLAFRDKLSPASGFQSFQLREIEFLLGLDEGKRIPIGNENTYMTALKNADGSDSIASRRVLARHAEGTSLKTGIYEWLFRTPICGSTPDDANDGAAVRAFLETYLAQHSAEVDFAQTRAVALAASDADAERLKGRFAAEKANARAYLFAEELDEAERGRHSRIRAAVVFIESYRELPLLAWPREVLDALVALEQAFLIFRQRHARMVERVIGRRTGTGGSAGVDYLDATALKYRVFGDIWAARTLLLQESALPSLADPDYYEFASGTPSQIPPAK